MARAVPRLGRILDVVGLALMLGAVACYSYAWSGLDGIRTGRTVVTGRMFATLTEAKAYSRVSDIGMAMAVAGFVVCIAAFVVTRRARTEPPS